MRIYIVEDGKLVSYERTGQCNRCGECCQKEIEYSLKTGLVDWDNHGTAAGADWSAWEGWTIFLHYGLWWYVKVNRDSIVNRDKPCPWFSNGATCSKWQDAETFAPVCRYWPFNPRDLEQFTRCGFRFERVTE